jgi:RimJ/RimL family protein N-acetyltransferase
VIVRPVHPADDLDALRAMRLEAVRDYPLAFTADLAETAARPREWWVDLVARNAGDGTSVIILADAGPAGLAGMAGIFSLAQPKLAHSGTIWGVYVRPQFRGRGVGEKLLRACIDWARGKQFVTLKLSVVAGNDVARRCYERCGFTPYGVEPLAVHWDGKFYDETLMVIRL